MKNFNILLQITFSQNFQQTEIGGKE